MRPLAVRGGASTGSGVGLFAFNFYLDGSSPSAILGTRKLEAPGYPALKTASLCVPWFDTIPESDGQTDGKTDMLPIAYTTLAKLSLQCAVIKIINKLKGILHSYNRNFKSELDRYIYV